MTDGFDDIRDQLREACANAGVVRFCVGVRLKIPEDADVTITYGGGPVDTE